MPTGTVKWFNVEKGFGFVVPDDPGTDIFVHISAVKDAGWETLEEGKRLEFELREGRNGRVSAADLRAEAGSGGGAASGGGGASSSGTIPALYVEDVSAAFTFYRRALGFEATGELEEDGQLVWGEVSRDGCKIWFINEAPEGTPSVPQMSGMIYLQVPSVDAVADEVPPTAVRSGPEDKPYGLREMVVEDPNGYILVFSQQI